MDSQFEKNIQISIESIMKTADIKLNNKLMACNLEYYRSCRLNSILLKLFYVSICI